jgi:hypothetical protein
MLFRRIRARRQARREQSGGVARLGPVKQIVANKVVSSIMSKVFAWVQWLVTRFMLR